MREKDKNINKCVLRKDIKLFKKNMSIITLMIKVLNKFNKTTA